MACLEKLRELEPILKQKHGITKLGLSGSVAPGDNTGNSAIDILIEGVSNENCQKANI